MSLRNSEPGVPMFDYGAIRTQYALMLPPGGKVAAYVHSGGYAAVNDAGFTSNVVETLAAGLAKCRANKGDIVYVLPGHTEDVTDATMLDNLVAGTKILGMGHGALKPAFTWTATGSQWTVDQADVVISGLQLNVDGANGVTNAIDVTAADCFFHGNLVRLGRTAALHAAIGMSLSAARAVVEGCKFYGLVAGAVTDGILIDTAVDGIEIRNTTMIAGSDTANGLIRVTAAATTLLFENLKLYNLTAASTATLALGDVACDGLAVRVHSGTKSNAGAKTSQGITWGTAALVQAHECYTSDVRADSAVLSPAAAAA